MPEPKRVKKGAQPKPKAIETQAFEAQADSFLEDLQMLPNGTEGTGPKPSGQVQAKPVVTKLIDFIKKM